MNEREALNEIFKVKQRKRKGWLMSGRGLNIHEVESVADHSWGAAFLAILLLPEDKSTLKKLVGNEIDIDLYNKDKIVQMLIVHDISEARWGDIPLIDKTDYDEDRERECIQNYRKTFAYSEHISSASYICKMWDEFDRQSDINSRIAKDIDRLECYYQLFVYKNKLIKVNGLANWNKLVKSWKNDLQCKTLFGIWMQKWIEIYIAD